HAGVRSRRPARDRRPRPPRGREDGGDRQPRRRRVMLPTPAPVGAERTGVVVVGTGAAGLSALLHLAAADVDCIAITRGAATDSATAWAQGGLAAVWDEADSLEAHVTDTLVAGAGLCDEAAVREL